MNVLKKLSKLNQQRKKLYEQAQKFDENIYWVTHAIIRFPPSLVNVSKVRRQLTGYNRHKANIEDKILKIDIEIYDIAKNVLEKSI